MEGQHYMDTIPATSNKATPTRKCVVSNSNQIRRETRQSGPPTNSKASGRRVRVVKDHKHTVSVHTAQPRVFRRQVPMVLGSFVEPPKKGITFWPLPVATTGKEADIAVKMMYFSLGQSRLEIFSHSSGELEVGFK
ncbi:hypothetical protein AVEN_85998-1 [Araneus ventricosus]|uniref:Uncharacterized protein n=1 Tax=Araneus ventricosus TaxID=182803 RepID=A0A4Y2SGC2_ARAVE|nr:hypothetical protein AVEN_85998-1 [Araneus ventricosus]